MANSVTVTFGYKNTDFTRKYKFEGLEDSALANVKANLLNFNDSLTAGTDGGLSTFFVSDDYDSANDIGTLTGIIAAQSEVTTVTPVDLT